MTRTTAELRQYLAGEWLFDNDFKDTSGNGNDGTPTDIEWKPTLRGMKPKFNGSSSLVDCGNGSSLNFGTGNFSYGCWYKPNISNTRQVIFAKGKPFDGGINYGYEISYRGDIANTPLYMVINGVAGDNFITLYHETNGVTEWFHVFCTYDKELNESKLYYNGLLVDANTASEESVNTTQPLYFGNNITKTGRWANGMCGNSNAYSTALTETEVLNLYNETKDAHGVIPAERSYQHNTDDVINASDAVGAWGTTKESTTELVDLSGNSKTAAIINAMPSGGFFSGRRFGGNSDYLSCGNIGNVKTVAMLVKPTTTTEYFTDLNATATIDSLSATIRANNFTDPTIYTGGVESSTLVANKWNSIIVTTASALSASAFNIGKIASNYFDGVFGFVIADDDEWSATEKTQHFNTLAKLQLWSINFTDYPDNVVTYTDSLPYSSTVISSGTFKVDADKFQCVSAGTITYRAAHDFDGSEYIKVTIAGVEYAGTGTITQGNTTVSVAQGSNKITITMGTADTIDSVDIQFRAEV